MRFLIMIKVFLIIQTIFYIKTSKKSLNEKHLNLEDNLDKIISSLTGIETEDDTNNKALS